MVATEERSIASDAAAHQFRLEIPLHERDWLRYDVSVRLKDAEDVNTEFVRQNNSRSLLYDNREKVFRVLYFGGRPNWQHKFILRALEGDPDVQLSSLVRISGAEKKFVFRGRDSSLGNPLFDGFEEAQTLPRYDEAVFLRLGLGPEELAAGYPSHAEDLYSFDLIIWGDIEADFFATPQLTLTRDAVSERGASLLLLGGSGDPFDALADTVIAPLIPTMPRGSAIEAADRPDRIAPTPEAFLTGVWALNGDQKLNDQAWDGLPELPDVQTPGPARIGATVMATSGEPSADDEASPFLVWQSYGRGTAALLATGETWPWHMKTEGTNGSHDRLWRQLVRALLRNVPDRVALKRSGASTVVGRDRTLGWSVRDEVFAPLGGATLRVTVTEPDGTATVVPALEVLAEPGSYNADMTPPTEGIYRLRLEGENGAGETVPETEMAVLAEPDRREWRTPRSNEGFLKEITMRTGGYYVSLNELQELPERIAAQEATVWRYDRAPLWHAPPFYVALLLLMATEWAVRRKAGKP